MSDTELGRLTDKLNQTIQEFEDGLNDLGLGVSAAVSFKGCTSRLAFVKRGKNFCLEIHEPGREHEPGRQDEDTETSLRNCARETRLRAVELFKPLFDALLAAVTNEHDRVLKAIDRVKNATTYVRESGVERPDKKADT